RPIGAVDSPAPAAWPRASLDTDLEGLIDKALLGDAPTVVIDAQGRERGLVDKQSLLRAIRGPVTRPAQAPSERIVAAGREAAPSAEAAIGPDRARFSLPAFLAGPAWAAHHGLWMLFALTLFGEAVALTLLGKGLVPQSEDTAVAGALLRGVVLLGLVHLALGLGGQWSSDLARRRRRGDPLLHARRAPMRTVLGVLLMVFVYALALYRFALPDPAAAI